MALTTGLKDFANALLRPLNVRVDSLTAARAERARLAALAARGHFDRPAFPVPEAIRACDPAPILRALPAFAASFERFRDPSANSSGYGFDNAYFSSPDAEVLYCLVRQHRPATILEIGCGNSTRVAREAIRDAGLPTRLVGVDPQPRVDIAGLVDEQLRAAVQDAAIQDRVASLRAGDILFIDSSHRVATGSDVVYLFLNLLPQLAPGVLVHVHDIFLPWDYPADWVLERAYGFNEQYLLLALLAGGAPFRVLWAGHYLQRTRADFAGFFPFAGTRRAQSFWMCRAA